MSRLHNRLIVNEAEVVRFLSSKLSRTVDVVRIEDKEPREILDMLRSCELVVGKECDHPIRIRYVCRSCFSPYHVFAPIRPSYVLAVATVTSGLLYGYFIAVANPFEFPT